MAQAIAHARQLVEEMPPTGGERLMELWQMVQRECGHRKRWEVDTPLQKLARLLVHPMQKWRRYCLHLTENGAELGVPATNTWLSRW